MESQACNNVLLAEVLLNHIIAAECLACHLNAKFRFYTEMLNVHIHYFFADNKKEKIEFENRENTKVSLYSTVA